MAAKYDVKKARNDEWQDIEITWRSFKVFQQQMRLLYRLENLANLPHLSEVNAILAIAEREGIPAIRKRAYLSPLEREFLKLVCALMGSEQEAWIPTVKAFLTGLGWHADLRGRNTLNPRDAKKVVRGNLISKMVSEFKRGCEFKRKAKLKRGFQSDESQIGTALVKMGYGPLEIEAILKSTSARVAACYKYWKLYEPQVPSFRTITNGFSRYLKDVARLKKPQ